MALIIQSEWISHHSWLFFFFFTLLPTPNHQVPLELLSHLCSHSLISNHISTDLVKNLISSHLYFSFFVTCFPYDSLTTCPPPTIHSLSASRRILLEYKSAHVWPILTIHHLFWPLLLTILLSSHMKLTAFLRIFHIFS